MIPTTNKPVCAECGRDKVRKDAWAEWNVEIQQWVLSETFGHTVYCIDCEADEEPDWIPT